MPADPMVKAAEGGGEVGWEDREDVSTLEEAGRPRSPRNRPPSRAPPGSRLAEPPKCNV